MDKTILEKEFKCPYCKAIVVLKYIEGSTTKEIFEGLQALQLELNNHIYKEHNIKAS